MRSALFLDRDGVVNYDSGYTHIWSECLVNREVINLIKKFRENAFLIIIITNQSGIGRGYYSEQDFHNFMDSMSEYLASLLAPIDGYFYCSCNPQKTSCYNRKPNPGMFYKAFQEFNINPKSSVMIGDKLTDILAAHDADIPNKYLYRSSESNLEDNQKPTDYSSILSLWEVQVPENKKEQI